MNGSNYHPYYYKLVGNLVTPRISDKISIECMNCCGRLEMRRLVNYLIWVVNELWVLKSYKS